MTCHAKYRYFHRLTMVTASAWVLERSRVGRNKAQTGLFIPTCAGGGLCARQNARPSKCRVFCKGNPINISDPLSGSPDPFLWVDYSAVTWHRGCCLDRLTVGVVVAVAVGLVGSMLRGIEVTFIPQSTPVQYLVVSSCSQGFGTG